MSSRGGLHFVQCLPGAGATPRAASPVTACCSSPSCMLFTFGKIPLRQKQTLSNGEGRGGVGVVGGWWGRAHLAFMRGAPQTSHQCAASFLLISVQASHRCCPFQRKNLEYVRLCEPMSHLLLNY